MIARSVQRTQSMEPPRITSPYAPDLGQLRAWLDKTIASLRFLELVTAIVGLVTRMGEINAELVKQLATLRRGRPRSERLDHLERQLVLPLGSIADAPLRPAPADGESDGKVKARRRGRHPGRAGFPARLERIVIPNPVPAAERLCPACGTEMTTVGHSRCETLDVVPAKVVVLVRQDETVACPKDDTIVSASSSPAIVERGTLGDTLLVEATCDKYLEHLPIERQCSRWGRYGVEIAPQTLGRGVSAHIDLLMPVARLIEAQTRAPGLLGTDATGIPVLDPSTSEGIRTGTVWCWTNARWVSFSYSPRGDAESVKRFLGEDLARTVQCDGTSVTNFLERTGGKRPGCWAHGRRRLVEAARAGDAIALDGVRTIARIFAVERASSIAGENALARRARRHAETRPILARSRPRRLWARRSDTSTGSGSASSSSSTTATSRRPTTAASASFAASSSDARTGSSPGSTSAPSAPRRS